MYRAAIYIRVNSGSQLDIAQAGKEEEALLKYCRENKLGIVGIYREYVDRIKGGKKVLSEVADLIKKQEIDHLAIMDYSKISSDLSEFLELYKMANRYGTVICGPNIKQCPTLGREYER